MSLLDDENILIEQVKLSVKDTIISFLQHNYLNELVEYLGNVMPVKDYQWKSITHPYTGDNMVVLADGVITVCLLKPTSVAKEPVMFFNPLSKYRLDKIEILNKLDIKYDTNFEIESAYFML